MQTYTSRPMRLTRRSILGSAAAMIATPAGCAGVPVQDRRLITRVRLFFWITTSSNSTLLTTRITTNHWAASFMRGSPLIATPSAPRLGAPRRVSYGPSEIERLDIYRTDRARAPIFVFIHGGSWIVGSAAEAGYAAEMFVKAGAHYIAPDFRHGQRDRRRPRCNGGASAPCDRVGLQERRELRRRPGSHLYWRPLVGRSSVWHRLGDRLGKRFWHPAHHRQRRAVRQRHVRNGASAAVVPQQLRETHRCDGGRHELQTAYRQPHRARHGRVWKPGDARNSSVRTATLRLRSRQPASPCNSSKRKITAMPRWRIALAVRTLRPVVPRWH